MDRHEEIQASYKALGGGFATLYDGIITRSSLIGKLTDSVVYAGLVNGSGEITAGGALLTVLFASMFVPAMSYLLSFAAGAMLYAVVEEMIPEMSAGEHSNIGVVPFALGFTLMMALDVALG